MAKWRRLSGTCLFLGALVTASVSGLNASPITSTTMQIVADNDFALFAGTSSSVTRLIYQNNVSWPDQLANLSNFTFSVPQSESTFYLLGMGGGGAENISGTVNGVDLTTIAVAMSSDLSPYLAGYNLDAVATGTYNASLGDVEAAVPQLTWGATTPTTPDDDYVATQSPNGRGFHFDPETAHLFRFNVADAGVTPTPEPSAVLLLLSGSGLIGLSFFRQRRSTRKA